MLLMNTVNAEQPSVMDPNIITTASSDDDDCSFITADKMKIRRRIVWVDKEIEDIDFSIHQ